MGKTKAMRARAEDLELVCLHLAKSQPARVRLAEMIAHAESSEPLWHLVETYIRFDMPLPVSMAKTLVSERKKTVKRGRHARAEEIGRQRAADMACFVAVEYLMQMKGHRLTPACEQVGKMMNLTRQSVCDAWKREQKRK